MKTKHFFYKGVETLRGSLEGKIQKGQYLLVVGLSRYIKQKYHIMMLFFLVGKKKKSKFILGGTSSVQLRKMVFALNDQIICDRYS